MTVDLISDGVLNLSAADQTTIEAQIMFFLHQYAEKEGNINISIDVILKDFSLQLVIITDYEDHRQTSIIFTYVFLI